MKSIQKKGKLSLNKKAIAKLDSSKMESVVGGQAAFTSIFNCSHGWTCFQSQSCTPTFSQNGDCNITVA